MERKDLIELMISLASDFARKIKLRSEMGYTDTGIHAEQATIPILDAVFDLKLTNANSIRKDYPAIDLFDKEKKVAFQITASATPAKVAKTLEKFIENKLHEQYATLFIYILTEKAASYNTRAIRDAIKDKLNFDAATHIIDYRDIV